MVQSWLLVRPSSEQARNRRLYWPGGIGWPRGSFRARWWPRRSLARHGGITTSTASRSRKEVRRRGSSKATRAARTALCSNAVDYAHLPPIAAQAGAAIDTRADRPGAAAADRSVQPAGAAGVLRVGSDGGGRRAHGPSLGGRQRPRAVRGHAPRVVPLASAQSAQSAMHAAASRSPLGPIGRPQDSHHSTVHTRRVGYSVTETWRIGRGLQRCQSVTTLQRGSLAATMAYQELSRGGTFALAML